MAPTVVAQSLEAQLSDLRALAESIGFRIDGPLADSRLVVLDQSIPIYTSRSLPATFGWLRGAAYVLRAAEVKAREPEPAAEAPAGGAR